MTSLRLILNGKAADDESIRTAVQAVRRGGLEVDVRVTWEAGDARRFARRAAEESVDAVVAGGGDGTLSEVVDGLLRSDVRFEGSAGLLPAGTANDFAEAMGLPIGDPRAALRLVEEAPPTPIDVGKVGERHFINMATAGAGSEIGAETPDKLKELLGRLGYLVSGLARFGEIRPVRGGLSAPDFEWEGEFLVLAVANGKQAAGFRLCPDAAPSDGLLHVAILPSERETDRFKLLSELLVGGLERIDERIVRSRVPWLAVEAPDGLHVNLDGEPLRGTRFRFELEPEALPFHLP